MSRISLGHRLESEHQEKEHPPWERESLKPSTYRWLLLLVVLVGTLLRIVYITHPFNGQGAHNATHYSVIALNFDRYALWSQRSPNGPPAEYIFSPGVPWLIWASFKLFGPHEWAARLPIVLSGAFAIVLVAILVRRLLHSDYVALISAWFTAIAPGVVYFAQNPQLDTPSIACGLAGAVFMLRYRATRQRDQLIASGLCLMLAIWFKFTAVLLYPVYIALWRPTRSWPAVMVFAGLTVLPSAVWVIAGWVAYNGLSTFSDRVWGLWWVVRAFVQAPLQVGAHLFLPISALVLMGIPIAWRWRSRLREIWMWCAPWMIPYIIAPWDALTNGYYDLPVTYLLTVLAALAVVSRSGESALRILAIVTILTITYDLADPNMYGAAESLTRRLPTVDSVPFYSAKVVADLPRGRTLVDRPQTVFYAGGDPAWVVCCTLDDVEPYIEAQEFDYIVLPDSAHGVFIRFVMTDAFRARLRRNHYIQIAPAAWAHERTLIANLDGMPDPSIPNWSPISVWRLRGMATWQ